MTFKRVSGPCTILGEGHLFLLPSSFFSGLGMSASVRKHKSRTMMAQKPFAQLFLERLSRGGSVDTYRYTPYMIIYALYMQHACIFICICTHVCTQLVLYTYLYVCIYTSYIYIYICIFARLCLCICTGISICIWVFKLKQPSARKGAPDLRRLGGRPFLQRRSEPF